MNAGLAHVAVLRRALLAPDQAADASWDAVLVFIGRGVASLMARTCNRYFARVEGASYTVSADRACLSLPRYPVETIAAVELRARWSDPWTSILDAVERVDEEAGLLHFAGCQGDLNASVRVTWTGGWWIDESEDLDGECPAGATPLPEELRMAWANQCQLVAEKKNIFQGGAIRAEDEHRNRAAELLQELELSAECMAALLPHRRFA